MTIARFFPKLSPVIIPAACLLLGGCTEPRSIPKKKPVEAKAQTTPTPDAKAEQKAGTTPDAKADTKTPPIVKAPPPKTKFPKGMRAPKGLSDEDVYEYNKSQGDPIGKPFTLEMALADDPALADKANGKLTATLETTMGDIKCELFEDKVPLTVANFAGLARGTRPWLDKKEDTWKKEPFYDGVQFHRVIRDFMIQTGDRSGSGRGDPGFILVDEFDKTLRHKGPGILSMANRGRNTSSSQFFVTVKSTPHLDNKHAVFGKCQDPKVAVSISQVKTHSDRPLQPIRIKTIKITREK